MSPFPWHQGLIIHDVDECRIREERELKRLKARRISTTQTK
jgi:hypothetical protein